MTDQQIFDKAREKYGLFHQTEKCIEEMAELTKELIKWIHGAPVMDHVAEEIADVRIVLDELVYYFGIKGDVEEVRKQKLLRLWGRMTCPAEPESVDHSEHVREAYSK